MTLQAGDRFGRYELVSWLGRGGMAETWRARLVGDAGVTKPVLIKKVLPEFANDEAFISMFISEARISATLSHGSIAQVFDFGRVDGEYFLAMEMCRGLHYAHTRTDEKGTPLGIVHRDISPDNVLISYEGQVKIVDFGIAKARLLRTFETEPGVVKGKYHFFSPEQARGKAVDARTDVWATGLVLYELLCGQPPVSGPPQTVMVRMANGDFPSPGEFREELPAELDALVMRALSVELSGRFESSHAFGDALAEFLYGFAPRLSSMNLAYLVRELFREELAREGRELAVPSSFQDELALWRGNAAARAPVREVVTATQPPRRARQPTVVRRAPPESELETVNSRAPRLSRGALIAGAGVLLTLGAGAVLLPTWKSESPARAADMNSLRVGNEVGAAVDRQRQQLAPPVTSTDDQSPGEVPSSRQPPQSTEPEVAGAPSVPPTAEKTAESQTRQQESASRAGVEADAAAHELRTLRDALVRKKYEQAVAAGKKCLALVPEHADCLLYLGSALVQNGRVEEGAEYYRRFIKLYPDHPKARPVRQIVDEYDAHSKRQKPPRQDAVASEVAAAVASEAAAQELRAVRTALAMRNYKEAVAAGKKCLEFVPDHADCLLYLGSSLARIHRPDEGATYYQRFLELHPHHPRAEAVRSLLDSYSAQFK